MATLSVSGVNSFRVAKHLGLHSTPMVEFLEADSQSFKVGAPLVWSSGYVAEASGDPTEIIGIAMRDGNNDTNNSVVKVVPALPGVIFQGHLANGSDLTTEYTSTQADVGKVYGIVKDSTNKGWLVDQDETTNVRVRVIGFKDAVGTANAVCYFTFLSYMDIDGTQKSVSGLYGTAT